MTTKERIIHIHVLQLFQTQTDEDRPISTFEIIEHLKGKGIVVDRKTVKDDIDTLFPLRCASRPRRPS